MLELLKQWKKKITEIPEDRKKLLITCGIIVGAVLLAAGVAYLVYRLLSKRNEEEPGDYDEDLEDDFIDEEEA
ncbi:MAG: hypothetical protein J5794_00795 [Lachnospiraceae bacterium]|nr:hypothetical protein [Lachnospiraceae bacterium]